MSERDAYPGAAVVVVSAWMGVPLMSEREAISILEEELSAATAELLERTAALKRSMERIERRVNGEHTELINPLGEMNGEGDALDRACIRIGVCHALLRRLRNEDPS